MPPIRSNPARLTMPVPNRLVKNSTVKPPVRISLEQPTIEVVPTDTVHIASGGQSSVYQLGPNCVLRELSTQPGSPEYIQEMEVARSFYGRHINGVANVLDVGEGYVVMERAPGVPLTQVIDSHPNGMPPRLATQIVQKVASALEELGKAGLVHRDIKPDNIMVEIGANGEVRSVKIIDLFTSARQTTTGPYDGILRAGTPTYASPEQLAGGGVTVKSDIYSLGKIFYRMLTGSRLFQGHPDGIARATLDENITVDHQAMQKVPAFLRGRVASMLSLIPNIRPTANDLGQGLESVIRIMPNSQTNSEVPVNKPKSTIVEETAVNEIGTPELTVRQPQGRMGPQAPVVEEPLGGGKPLPPEEATVKDVPIRRNSVPNVESIPGRGPISFRGLATSFGGLALPLGVGFGTYYGLGQVGVESEGVKLVTSVGTGHAAGVGLTRLVTGSTPGLGAQATGLISGLGGGLIASRVYTDGLNHANVDQDSIARSTPVHIGVGFSGGVAMTFASKRAFMAVAPFAVTAILNEVPKYIQPPEDYQAKVSEVEQARQRMAYLATHRDGLESVVATVALGLSLVPIFDGLVTLASDATASSAKPVTAVPLSSPDRLTPAERASLTAAPPQSTVPVNPLPLRPTFISSFTPSMSLMSSRF